nr:hypothetical protein Iba_scaffold47461CG0010 [Ipomoea batatas]GME06099.1 hypothetical protein Iba_scaffold3961.4CG0020 [Ipomoea batatas]
MIIVYGLQHQNYCCCCIQLQCSKELCGQRSRLENTPNKIENISADPSAKKCKRDATGRFVLEVGNNLRDFCYPPTD